MLIVSIKIIYFLWKCESSIPGHKVIVTTNFAPCIKKSSSICEYKVPEIRKAKIHRDKIHASLIFFIPNCLLSRQGKSLDYVLAYLVDITL